LILGEDPRGVGSLSDNKAVPQPVMLQGKQHAINWNKSKPVISLHVDMVYTPCNPDLVAAETSATTHDDQHITLNTRQIAPGPAHEHYLPPFRGSNMPPPLPLNLDPTSATNKVGMVDESPAKLKRSSGRVKGSAGGPSVTIVGDTSTAQSSAAAPAKKRGRPPGSKNKKKGVA
jgi:hypothetical protein